MNRESRWWIGLLANVSGASAVFLGAVVAWWARMRGGDHVLWASSVMLLVLGGVSFGLVVVGWIRLRRRLASIATQGPLPLDCGKKKSTGFLLGRLPLMAVDLVWREPSAVEVKYEDGQEWVAPKRRGLFKKVVREIGIRDPFHLFRLRLIYDPSSPCEVHIQPALSAPSEEPGRATLAHGGDLPALEGRADGDRMEIRPYQEGDSSRHIAWKTVARSGGEKLFVRTPEVVGQELVAIFLVAGEGDDASAELARCAIEDKWFGANWVFGASRTLAEGGEPLTVTSEDADVAMEWLAASGNAPLVPTETTALQGFEEAVLRMGATCCFVLVPCLKGEDWMGQLETDAPPTMNRVVLVGFHEEDQTQALEVCAALSDQDAKPVCMRAGRAA